MDQDRLKRRVDGRTQAKAILELLTLDHPDKITAFLDELRSTLQPKEVTAEVQSAKRRLSELASHELKYGIHGGERLDDIPRDYLGWMVDDGQKTIDIIRAYLLATKHLDGPTE